MKALHNPSPSCRTKAKPVNRIGRVVYCVHCFRSLGLEDAATSRASLLAKHNCIESQMAKQPAAPPPYN